MTDMVAEPGDQPARQKAALLWTLCGVGNTIYAVIQILTLVNHQLDTSGTAPPAFDAVALWYFGVVCSLWIVPPLIPLVTSGRAANMASTLLGSFLIVTSVAGGLFDGMRDGLHITATAILALALPGVFAIRTSWRLLRRSGAPTHRTMEAAS